MKLIFTEEYKFLLNLFFNEKKIDLKNIKKINNERLITISSTFLLLPLLYVRLKNNKLLLHALSGAHSPTLHSTRRIAGASRRGRAHQIVTVSTALHRA